MERFPIKMIRADEPVKEPYTADELERLLKKAYEPKKKWRKEKQTQKCPLKNLPFLRGHSHVSLDE